MHTSPECDAISDDRQYRTGLRTLLMSLIFTMASLLVALATLMTPAAVFAGLAVPGALLAIAYDWITCQQIRDARHASFIRTLEGK